MCGGPSRLRREHARCARPGVRLFGQRPKPRREGFRLNLWRAMGRDGPAQRPIHEPLRALSGIPAGRRRHVHRNALGQSRVHRFRHGGVRIPHTRHAQGARARGRHRSRQRRAESSGSAQPAGYVAAPNLFGLCVQSWPQHREQVVQHMTGRFGIARLQILPRPDAHLPLRFQQALDRIHGGHHRLAQPAHRFDRVEVLPRTAEEP